MNLSKILIVLTTIFASLTSNAETASIGNQLIPTTIISKEEAIRLYTGKST